jgi:hypothetical protein
MNTNGTADEAPPSSKLWHTHWMNRLIGMRLSDNSNGVNYITEMFSVAPRKNEED